MQHTSRDLSASQVGQRILFRRLALDLSRDALAERAGSDPMLIFAYEIGQGLPAPMEMVRIARALDARIGFFFGEPACTDHSAWQPQPA